MPAFRAHIVTASVASRKKISGALSAGAGKGAEAEASQVQVIDTRAAALRKVHAGNVVSGLLVVGTLVVCIGTRCGTGG